MKRTKIIIALILLIVIVATTLNFSLTSLSRTATVTISSKKTSEEVNNEYQGLIIEAQDLIKDSIDEKDIKNNTLYLQQCIDNASNAGGGIVRIPAGTYYFASAGANARKNEEYVIKAKNNVLIEGAGIDDIDSDKCTILKPYGKVTSATTGGIDMFYHNEYHDSNFNENTYLENADFRNFIIDGEDTEGKEYNSSGKGFLLVLTKNCDFENILVRNTEATGFGIECPINCTINNCIAANCGRSAKSTDQGGSGFGIGTGYSNEESIYISNSIAIGNKKFGFFFGHNTRYCAEKATYSATRSNGFVVSNCTASGNMYDFGGSRAYDVTLENCKSDKSSINENVTNVLPIYFELASTRIHLVNNTIEQKFIDVIDNSTHFYEPVYWALNNGITAGISKTEFRPLESATRAQAIVFLWRMAERPGEVVYTCGRLDEDGNRHYEQLETGYTDVETDAQYAKAIKWAEEQGIISKDTKFSPSAECTRAQFITMLWRYAGKPIVETESSFTDVTAGAYYEDAVNWAASQGILKGTTETTFSPNQGCARANVVTFLYRYANTKNQFNITYNLGGGEFTEVNPTSYTPGEDIITLNNPTRDGYTFIGWTGSNYSEYIETENYIPELNVEINEKDFGNKTYTANWEANKYAICFDSNCGNGEMNKQYFVYNDIPQQLLKNMFTKTGYTFTGWNTKADGTGIEFKDREIIQNLTTQNKVKGVLYAQWKAGLVEYKVEHYRQKLDGTYSEIPTDVQTLKAKADTMVTPNTINYMGYISPSKQKVKVEADGSTVVKYYYSKNAHEKKSIENNIYYKQLKTMFPVLTF